MYCDKMHQRHATGENTILSSWRLDSICKKCSRSNPWSTLQENKLKPCLSSQERNCWNWISIGRSHFSFRWCLTDPFDPRIKLLFHERNQQSFLVQPTIISKRWSYVGGWCQQGHATRKFLQKVPSSFIALIFPWIDTIQRWLNQDKSCKCHWRLIV